MLRCQSLPEPSCLLSCSEWFSCFSPACPGQHFLCLILLETHQALSVYLDVSPRSEKLIAPSKAISYSLSFLYKTLTKCILGDFSSCFPHLWPVFHSFFCFHIFYFLFLLSNSEYFLQVVLQFINYLLGHLPFINFTFPALRILFFSLSKVRQIWSPLSACHCLLF